MERLTCIPGPDPRSKILPGVWGLLTNEATNPSDAPKRETVESTRKSMDL